MSFLKIADPIERERTVKEFPAIKKNIRANELAEKTGKIELRTDLSEFFKPLTETQKETQRAITSGLRPIRKGLRPIKGLKGIKTAIEKLPKAIDFPTFPSIKAYSQEGLTDEEIAEIMKYAEKEEEEPLSPITFIGPLAAQQLRRYTNKGEADTTYGIYDKKGKFYIGNKEAEILEDDILVEDKIYEGTPGLWELIIARRPDKSKYNEEDFNNYKEIMIKSNTLRRGNDPTSNLPKSSKSYKWKNILSHIWNDASTLGKGIVIPGDPNVLLEKLDLLMASKAAGNMGVRNELVSVCDELKRQGIFDSKSYKKIMSVL